MDIKSYMQPEGEQPLDNIVSDGGFCGIFRSIACVGDSLASGEFECINDDGTKAYRDYYDYSWGQYLARMAGTKVYNFSKGGMTTKRYVEGWAEEMGYWSEDKACQCYIIALGINDIIGGKVEVFGDISDIDPLSPENCKPTYMGHYGHIIAKYKQISPNARFFLIVPPKHGNEEQREQIQSALYEIAELFEHTYVIDLYKYAPPYDKEFRKHFFLGGHMNPMGYIISAKLIASYIDYIIRHNPDDFKLVGLIGTPYYEKTEEGQKK
ncbi:MAG: SGNH/GDSL hydrolase family protein [Ruminococcaceae bacterium]|nr:SGNH/GDSL hydrolase family protein [Oscillospiraceae bacterium]